MQLYISDSDSIAVFGSGSFAGRCVQLIRKFSLCKIYVFEKQINKISTLQKQVEKMNNVFYAQVHTDIESQTLEIAPKIIFSISNIYLFKDELIKFPIINYHNALLPCHPGRNAEAWTIFSQDAVAGVTWHFVENKVDAGDIILQEEVPMHDRMTAIQLLSQQTKTAYKMFDSILIDIFEKHSLKGHKQIPMENTKFHFSWERPNNGLLDLSWSTRKMSAFLRSMDYGKLNMLGDPALQYQDATFVWDRYIIEDSQRPKETCFDFVNGEALFTGNGLSIKLLGLRQA